MQLNAQQQQIRESTKRFAEAEISPFVKQWEAAGSAPRALYEKMAALGLMGMTVGPEHGGVGADFVSYAIALEELSAADGGICNVMSAHNSPVALA